MQTKLTLSIDESVIEQAKQYAKEQGVSLSKLVQEFLLERAKSSRQKSQDVFEVPDHLKELCGVIELPEDFDYKKEKAKWLTDKYMKLK